MDKKVGFMSASMEREREREREWIFKLLNQEFVIAAIVGGKLIEVTMYNIIYMYVH